MSNCVSWLSITTDNQTKKQQLINIHWQNVCLTLTHLFSLTAHCTLARLDDDDNTARGGIIKHMYEVHIRVTDLHL